MKKLALTSLRKLNTLTNSFWIQAGSMTEVHQTPTPIVLNENRVPDDAADD